MKQKLDIQKKYDYIIIGAGLAGATCARLLADEGKTILIIDSRNHIGGNCYSERMDGIEVHRYGPHIFHTDSEKIWNFVNKYTVFNEYINSPIAEYNGRYYNLPINMNTLIQIYPNVVPSPDAMTAEILKDIPEEYLEFRNGHKKATNLEEHIISQVGTKIYNTFIKDYTEKQWGKSCSELSPEIIKRIPIRMTFDNNYFSDRFQGIPKYGYQDLFNKMLIDDKIDIILEYNVQEEDLSYLLERTRQFIIYTGDLNEIVPENLQRIPYRSLRFDFQAHDASTDKSLPKTAVINHTGNNSRYTRSVDYRYFDKNCHQRNSVIVHEESVEWYKGWLIPYYPILSEDAHSKYMDARDYLRSKYPRLRFCGRIATYRYLDMDDTIDNAFTCVNNMKYDYVRCEESSETI